MVFTIQDKVSCSCYLILFVDSREPKKSRKGHLPVKSAEVSPISSFTITMPAQVAHDAVRVGLDVGRDVLTFSKSKRLLRPTVELLERPVCAVVTSKAGLVTLAACDRLEHLTETILAYQRAVAASGDVGVNRTDALVDAVVAHRTVISPVCTYQSIDGARCTGSQV